MVLTIMGAVSPVVSALNVEPGVGAGLQYTDNAALTPSNEDSDLIAVGYVGALIEEDEGPLRANARASLTYVDYTDGTFTDKYYFNLRAKSSWEQIQGRLNWAIQDYFAQTPINNLDSGTPDNIQNTNVFSFGPNISFGLSPRNKLIVSPVFRDFYYEERDTDNQQFGIDVNLLHEVYPTMSAGLVGGVVKVDYDKDEINPDYTISNLHALVAGEGARSEYRVEFGGTHIDRDRFDNVDGASGSLTWLYNVTGRSSARAYLASLITDTNAGFLRSEIDPDNGDFSNEQISGDVIRNNIARLSYLRHGATLETGIWTELRDLDYKESPDDREVKEFGAKMDYQVTALLSAGIYGKYRRTKRTDISRTDREHTFGGNLGFKLSRKLRTNFYLQYKNKDSTRATSEYKELSAFASLVYGFGNILSPASNRDESRYSPFWR